MPELDKLHTAQHLVKTATAYQRDPLEISKENCFSSIKYLLYLFHAQCWFQEFFFQHK